MERSLALWGSGTEEGSRQQLLSSGLPALLPEMYDELCISHAAFCQTVGWVGFFGSSTYAT